MTMMVEPIFVAAAHIMGFLGVFLTYCLIVPMPMYFYALLKYGLKYKFKTRMRQHICLLVCGAITAFISFMYFILAMVMQGVKIFPEFLGG